MKLSLMLIAGATVLMAGCASKVPVNATSTKAPAATTQAQSHTHHKQPNQVVNANQSATHTQLVHDAKAHASHLHYHCQSHGTEPVTGSVNTQPNGQNSIILKTSLPELNLQPAHFALGQITSASGNLYQGQLSDGRVVQWHVKGNQAILSSQFDNVSFDLHCHIHNH